MEMVWTSGESDQFNQPFNLWKPFNKFHPASKPGSYGTSRFSTKQARGKKPMGYVVPTEVIITVF
jgi:hypothetical protein